MIKLAFTGDKPFISHKGVDFIKGRPDKYMYIPSAVKLYQLMKDPANWHGNKLSFDFPKTMMHDAQMLEIITKNDAALIEGVRVRLLKYDKETEELIEQITVSPQFDEKERETYINNIKIMQPYRRQRSCNKMLYHVLVNSIVGEIIKKEIQVIETPPTKAFYHLIDSIKGELIGKRLSSCVTVTIENKGEIGVLRLDTSICPI
jgi:hypothetical protein